MQTVCASKVYSRCQVSHYSRNRTSHGRQSVLFRFSKDSKSTPTESMATNVSVIGAAVNVQARSFAQASAMPLHGGIIRAHGFFARPVSKNRPSISSISIRSSPIGATPRRLAAPSSSGEISSSEESGASQSMRSRRLLEPF